MSKQAYEQDLRNRLASIDARLLEAEGKYAHGGPRDKVAVAGEIAVLKERHDELNNKIQRLSAEPVGAWETLKTEIEEELDSLLDDLKRAISGV